MWTIVYIAGNSFQANSVKDLLMREGLLVETRSIGLSMAGDGSYEVLVLESEAEEAQEILCQYDELAMMHRIGK